MRRRNKWAPAVALTLLSQLCLACPDPGSSVVLEGDLGPGALVTKLPNPSMGHRSISPGPNSHRFFLANGDRELVVAEPLDLLAGKKLLILPADLKLCRQIK